MFFFGLLSGAKVVFSFGLAKYNLFFFTLSLLVVHFINSDSFAALAIKVRRLRHFYLNNMEIKI